MAQSSSTSQDLDYSLYSFPRKFGFAIVCLNCNFRVNNLPDMRQHIMTSCSHKESYHVRCGHCEFQTTNWPQLARHVNNLKTHEAQPYRACYAWTEIEPPKFDPTPTMQSELENDTFATTTTASIVYAPTTSFDIKSPDSPLPELPRPPETPPLLKEGVLQQLEDQPPSSAIHFLPDTPPRVYFSQPLSLPVKPSYLETLSFITIPPKISSCTKETAITTGLTNMDFSESISGDDMICGSIAFPKSTITMQTMTVSADSSTDEPVTDISPNSVKAEKPETIVCSSTDEVQEVKPLIYHDTSRGRQKEKDKCKLIIHLADTIGFLATGQPNSERLRKERAKFVAKGLWPANLGTTSDVTSEEISLRLGDFYRGKLSALEDN